MVGFEAADVRARASREVVAATSSGRRWALPLETVERVLPMVAVTPLPDSPVGIRGAINVHGESVPVLDLDARLGLPAREHGPDARLLLARTSRRRVALVVDDVDGVIEVPAIEPAPEATPAPVAGTAVLPDGLLVIYDVDAFLSPEEDEAVAAALAGAGT
jgi:purine-binding chemotaxis protein CheW